MPSPSRCIDTDIGTDTAAKTCRGVLEADMATCTDIEFVRTCRRSGVNSVTLAARWSRLGLRTDTWICMWCQFLILLQISKHTQKQRQLQIETYMIQILSPCGHVYIQPRALWPPPLECSICIGRGGAPQLVDRRRWLSTYVCCCNWC